MSKKYLNLYGFFHAVGDIIILNFAFIIGNLIPKENFSFIYDTKYLQLWIYVNLIYLIAANFSKSHEIHRNTRFRTIFSRLVQLFLYQIPLTFSYIVVFKDFNDTFKISREVLLWTYGISIFLTMIWRLGFIKIVRFYRARGFNNRNVVIVGAGKEGQNVKNMLTNKMEYGFNFIGYFDDEANRYKEVKDEIIGPVDDVIDFAIENKIEEIFCALPSKYHKKIRRLITLAEENCIRLKIVPDFNRVISNPLSKIEIDHYGLVPIITLRNEPLDNIVNRIIKRTFDFAFTFFMFIFLLWWLIPLISIIIKLDNPGPAFFIQQRSGEMNRPFNVFKFRTMKVNNEANSRQAVKGDDRITRVGKFLRKFSLDELPQFINVLLGSMSVIGPRPHMLKHTKEYSKIIDKFMVRHFVKPGITGWAQVHGLRGETQDPIKMEKRVEKDVYYIENWSLFLDIEILFRTLFNIHNGE